MDNPLITLADQLADDPLFLAYYVRQYLLQEKITEQQLSEDLGCTLENLHKIRLCRSPGTEAGQFRSDVQRVGARYGADPERLAAIIRQVEGVAAFQQSPTRDLGKGFLLAARDAPAPPPESTS